MQFENTHLCIKRIKMKIDKFAKIIRNYWCHYLHALQMETWSIMIPNLFCNQGASRKIISRTHSSSGCSANQTIIVIQLAVLVKQNSETESLRNELSRPQFQICPCLLPSTDEFALKSMQCSEIVSLSYLGDNNQKPSFWWLLNRPLLTDIGCFFWLAKMNFDRMCIPRLWRNGC